MTVLVSLMLGVACSTSCEAMAAGPDRDSCFHDRVVNAKSPMDAAAVYAAVSSIEDATVRQAAVMTWVKANRGTFSQADGERVCSVLTHPHRSYCERQLTAVHLNR